MEHKKKNSLKVNWFMRYLDRLFQGISLGLGFVLVLVGLFLLAYAGWHPASQIISGVFKGNYTFAGNVAFNKNVTIHNISIVPLGENKVVYFYPSMTAEQIQKIIDEQPKYIPAGKTLTFQFTNGVYNLNNSLKFVGFYGGGYLNIQGNITEPNATTLHTTQKVFLNFTNPSFRKGGIIIYLTDYAQVRNLKIKVITDENLNEGIYGHFNKVLLVNYNYIEGTSLNNGQGIDVEYSSIAYLRYNYVSNIWAGIDSHGSAMVLSFYNKNTSIPPAYGLVAENGGELSREGFQPSGSINDTLAWYGGEIR